LLEGLIKLLGCKKDKDVIKALRKFGADNKEYYDSPQLGKEEKHINVRIYEQSTIAIGEIT
jgi:hypothetical protein